MNRLTPLVPDNCEVRGYLVESPDFGDMTEDMLEVSLPGGILIDAGWYPEWDPSGCYVVTARSGIKVIRSRECVTLEEASRCVTQFARTFNENVFAGESTVESADTTIVNGFSINLNRSATLVFS